MAGHPVSSYVRRPFSSKENLEVESWAATAQRQLVVQSDFTRQVQAQASDESERLRQVSAHSEELGTHYQKSLL